MVRSSDPKTRRVQAITPTIVILVLAAMTFGRSVLGAEALPAVPGTPPAASPAPGASAATPAPAPSLFAAPQHRRSGSLFKASIATRELPATGKEPAAGFIHVPEPEPKTLKKHDLVTIIIREESEVKSDSKTEAKKADALDAKVDAMVKLMSSKPYVTGGGIGDQIPEVKMSGSRDFSGEGSANRSDSFTTRVTAEVVDVKPNNTLVLQATKHIKTDDEEQNLVLTGICRVEDLSPDNSVLSTQLHDLSVNKQNKGSVRDASKQGWVGRAFDFINPF